MKNVILVIGIICGVVGCGGVEMEDAQAGHSNPDEPGEVTASVTCDSGYHLHTVDWDVGFCTDGACCNSKMLQQGTSFCMKSTSDGLTCFGHWRVFGYRPTSTGKEYGWLRIEALNGH